MTVFGSTGHGNGLCPLSWPVFNKDCFNWTIMEFNLSPKYPIFMCDPMEPRKDYNGFLRLGFQGAVNYHMVLYIKTGSSGN